MYLTGDHKHHHSELFVNLLWLPGANGGRITFSQTCTNKGICKNFQLLHDSAGLLLLAICSDGLIYGIALALPVCFSAAT